MKLLSKRYGLELTEVGGKLYGPAGTILNDLISLNIFKLTVPPHLFIEQEATVVPAVLRGKLTPTVLLRSGSTGVFLVPEIAEEMYAIGMQPRSSQET